MENEKKCPKCAYGWLEKAIIRNEVRWGCDECKYTELVEEYINEPLEMAKMDLQDRLAETLID